MCWCWRLDHKRLVQTHGGVGGGKLGCCLEVVGDYKWSCCALVDTGVIGGNVGSVRGSRGVEDDESTLSLSWWVSI